MFSRSGHSTYSPIIAALLGCACSQSLAQQHNEINARPINKANTSPSLKLKAGQAILAPMPNAKLLDRASLDALPKRMIIVLESTITPSMRKQIQATGTRMGDYLPDRAYVVDLSRSNIAQLRDLPFITHMVPFQDAWKLDLDLGKRVPQTSARQLIASQGKVAAHVYLFAGEQVTDAIKAINTHTGLKIVRHELADDRFLIEVIGTSTQIESLAKIASIQWIESAPEITSRNSTNRWIVQSNSDGFFPVYDAGIHGENQLIAVMDGKVDLNHCAFLDPEGDPIGDDHRKIQAFNSPIDTPDLHGTHVAATALGDNNIDDDNRGIAYKSRMIFSIEPAFTFASVSSRLSTHYSQGAAIHTNSWGDDGSTAYTGMSRAVDTFSFNNDDNLVIFAVSNLSTLRTPENAKNCLAVGASQDAGVQGDFCVGGIGPTADGRRKPEIFAPGCDTESARAFTSCSTLGFTGTSMATPAVAGSAALIKQYYEDGFYPSGLAESADGFVPSGPLLKATLLNSAVDMIGIAGYPSNQEGWGRVLLDNALFFDGDTNKIIIHDVRNASNDALNTNDMYEMNFTVHSTTEPLKVTLVWHDAPAAPNASFTPVNNLDLEIINPIGGLFVGNSITNGVSTTGGTPDQINNVEMVMLPMPTPGDYTLRVKAPQINQGQQGYALVITGDVTELSPAGCNGADLAEPFGVFNFFDVAAFLDAFAANFPAADLDNNGVLNFFDVAVFLELYSEGCPDNGSS